MLIIVPITVAKTYNREKYRYFRLCPLSGECGNTHPLRKLSNHFVCKHPNVSKEDRAKYLKVTRHQAKT